MAWKQRPRLNLQPALLHIQTSPQVCPRLLLSAPHTHCGSGCVSTMSKLVIVKLPKLLLVPCIFAAFFLEFKVYKNIRMGTMKQDFAALGILPYLLARLIW